MSKRKPSKHSASPKIAAKAQRAAQAIVRSPSASRLRSLGTGSTESPPKYNKPEQEALLVENSATVSQDERMADNEPKGALDFSSAAANVRPYQAMLLEMVQANMQFSFEFAQRFAAIRSPVEFFSVIAEFTGKRTAMLQKYSKEMAQFRSMR